MYYMMKKGNVNMLYTMEKANGCWIVYTPEGEFFSAFVRKRDARDCLAYSNAKVTKTVKSLMSGQDVEIALDTPLCCDPSSETYWSM